jgi:hypothetical protein
VQAAQAWQGCEVQHDDTWQVAERARPAGVKAAQSLWL